MPGDVKLADFQGKWVILEFWTTTCGPCIMRGLPEMSIKDISIENVLIESKTGLLCQEAENIRFKNVTLLSTDTRPVLEVQNSQNIGLDGIHYANGADLLLRVSGDRSRDIRVTNTDTKQAKQAVEAGSEVGKKVVAIK